jgi:hypothetical protein
MEYILQNVLYYAEAVQLEQKAQNGNKKLNPKARN